ncbi:MAG: hypothetical protein GC165_07450 [Armatimonadetes bacterium]|nr:hypothetical protein [Armatimonadota bacterium]
MASVLRYLRGRDTTVLTITAQDVSVAGVLSDTVGGSGSLIGGRLDGCRIGGHNVTDMIMAVDDTVENNVPLYTSFNIEVSEILTQKTGTGGIALGDAANYEPLLPYLFWKAPSGTSTYTYFKITITKGGKTYTVYGVKDSITDGVSGQGKQVVTMTLKPVNPNFDGTSLYVNYQ